MPRGSRKHVLDWTSRPQFGAELLEVVQPIDALISVPSLWMPKGHDSPQEARLENLNSGILPDVNIRQSLRAWWLAHSGNTPNWDIALSCAIDGKPGIVLVEAKANVPELNIAGKKCDTGASAKSQANHEQIGRAISEANKALCQVHPDTCISRDSHYQLANRLAFAWKLASLGVPTVLIYLGFVGDDGISDAGEPFRDAAHWNQTFCRLCTQSGSRGPIRAGR